MAVKYTGSKKSPKNLRSVLAIVLEILKKSTISIMKRSVVSFHKPINTLTIEGSVDLTAVGHTIWSLI